MNFHNLVEEIRGLDLAGKQEMRNLLDKLLAEERRAEIARHAEEALGEYESGELEFSDDPGELRRLLS